MSQPDLDLRSDADLHPPPADPPWRPARGMVLAVAHAADGGCLFVVTADDGRCGVFRRVDGPAGAVSPSTATVPAAAASAEGALPEPARPGEGSAAQVLPGDIGCRVGDVPGPPRLTADNGHWHAVCWRGPLTRGDAMVCLAAGAGRAPA